LIYGGLLGESSTESCLVLIRSIVQSLREGEADFAFFNFLHNDCSLLNWSRTLPGMLSRDFFPATQPHRGMQLPRTPEKLYDNLPSKQRKNQRWQAKKFEKAFPGELEIRCFQEPAVLDRMFADVEVVAKKTYQRGLGVGFVDDLEMRERISLAAKSGWLRAYMLYVGANPCAFWIGNVFQDTFYSSYMGYDPVYMQYSPGMYLIMKVLEQFCGGDKSQRLQTVDFGLGDAQYKQVLGDISWEETSTYIFAPTLGGYSLNLLRAPVAFLNGFAKKALERTQVLMKIKRTWRRHARV
jgi:CelD/BcsL family acetyltransferase involved in cellulose biosynthesis